MINRLLSWYWRLGGVVIATSNRLPQGSQYPPYSRPILTRATADLYNSGVQRNSVNTFLDALEARCPPVELRSATDYRREQRGVDLDNSTDREAGDYGTPEAWKRWGSASKAWFVRGQEKEFKNAVDRIIGDVEGTPANLKVSPLSSTIVSLADASRQVYGRDLVVPWAYKGVAKFSFKTLCEGALGPADYITLGSTYHTIILTDVPVLLLNAKNEARRLITLIDSLCAWFRLSFVHSTNAVTVRQTRPSRSSSSTRKPESRISFSPISPPPPSSPTRHTFRTTSSLPPPTMSSPRADRRTPSRPNESTKQTTISPRIPLSNERPRTTNRLVIR